MGTVDGLLRWSLAGVLGFEGCPQGQGEQVGGQRQARQRCLRPGRGRPGGTFPWQLLPRLIEYLRQRQRVQGRVLGSDELEFIGSFIHHDDLEIGLKHGMDFVRLNPYYSDFFGNLYDHIKNCE